jgi:hypothetical protein
MRPGTVKMPAPTTVAMISAAPSAVRSFARTPSLIF